MKPPRPSGTKVRRPVTAGDVLKDEGIERVMAPNENWRWLCTMLVDTPAFWDQTVTGEVLRQYCEAHDLHPHHHNAWGGWISGLRKQGILERVGHTLMSRPSSHSRENPVYRMVPPEERDV